MSGHTCSDRAPIKIPQDEIEISGIRASGAGGQRVNKVETAVSLRFDIEASSLPGSLKRQLLSLQDHRITRDGVIQIKAQTHASRERNRQDALARLESMVVKASRKLKPRVKTKPSAASIRKRLDIKNRKGLLKRMRKRIEDH